jgi:hypothetical protein
MREQVKRRSGQKQRKIAGWFWFRKKHVKSMKGLSVRQVIQFEIKNSMQRKTFIEEIKKLSKKERSKVKELD